MRCPLYFSSSGLGTAAAGDTGSALLILAVIPVMLSSPRTNGAGSTFVTALHCVEH